jgi:cytochrome c oxidase assembly protein Cox11
VGMIVAVVVAMSVIVVMVMVMVVVIVVLAHASVPVEGSAICSSISLRTPLIWASAAE